jgi:hypothetical protein
MAGKGFRPVGNAEQTADGAQCRGGVGQTATDQHRGNLRLLLHLIGQRNISCGRAADVEHQIRRQSHDVFEIDRIAAAGKAPDLGELGIRAGKNGRASGAGARVQPSIFSCIIADKDGDKASLVFQGKGTAPGRICPLISKPDFLISS